MEGIKKFSKILGIFIPFFAIFLMSQNTFAASISTSRFDLLYIGQPGGSYTWANQLLYNQNTSLFYAKQYQFTTASIVPNGNYASIHFETNIVANSFSQNYLNFVNRDYMSVLACSSSVSGALTIQGSSVTTAVTTWTDSNNRPSKTLTVYGDVALGGLTVNSSQQIVCAVGSRDYAFFSTNNNANAANMYFEQNPMSILYTNNNTESFLQSQIYQNDTIINQNNTMIQDSQEYYDKQYDSIDNIEGQSSSDIQGSENQQTTNLIGIITSFIDVLRGNGTSSNCNITLPFPEFLGGNNTVNICSGKNYYQLSNTNYAVIFSRLFLICFFVPLIWILLKLIYNEIRSWTNG